MLDWYLKLYLVFSRPGKLLHKLLKTKKMLSRNFVMIWTIWYAFKIQIFFYEDMFTIAIYVVEILFDLFDY